MGSKLCIYIYIWAARICLLLVYLEIVCFLVLAVFRAAAQVRPSGNDHTNTNNDNNNTNNHSNDNNNSNNNTTNNSNNHISINMNIKDNRYYYYC